MGRSGGGRGMSGGAMNGNGAAAGDAGAKQRGTFAVKTGLAQMLKGGVIMDVVNPEQARIAEEAGAVAVMALERVPADIRKDGGIARMSDPEMIRGIKAAVTIPVMAKARIGHFVEAQILESLGVDYLDESEVLTPADETHHINKHKFNIPFVCGCRDLGEALRRISEGAAGTGDVVEAVRHTRSVGGQIRKLQSMDEDELYVFAKEIRAPIELVRQTRDLGRLPVVNFAAGGVATPADAALMMQLGVDGVFVRSGIFKSGDPKKAPRPSCRRPPTTTTRRSSPRSPWVSASPWWASTARARTSSATPTAVSEAPSRPGAHVACLPQRRFSLSLVAK